MVREARSGERISFVTSAKKGSLGLILEPSASGSIFVEPTVSITMHYQSFSIIQRYSGSPIMMLNGKVMARDIVK